ncbi:DMT family transporter [Oryzibacter oryziterrae]|uniref:DMT family transporter n=1 Tax=Oryzibacter oryziterrae TaxID=2766474 RepID=UPI001F23ABA8|nr:DMT family transporter [Oryzibacter oryziterrae]
MSSASRSAPLAGYAFAILGAVLFASKGIIIKFAYRTGVDALTLLMLRMALSVPIFLAVGLWTYARDRSRNAAPVEKSALLQALVVGMVGYWFSSYADFKGLETLTPQFERLILFTYPAFVVLLGALLFDLPIRLKSFAAFGVSYLGLALIFLTDLEQSGTVVVDGALWVLAAAVTFALYQLLAKGGIARLGAPLFTSVAMTGAAIAVAIHYGLTHDFVAPSVSPELFHIALLLAIGATVLPSYLMSFALARISAQANSTIGTLSPVVTLLLAVALLGEPLRLVDAVGTTLVIGGVALFTFVERRA